MQTRRHAADQENNAGFRAGGSSGVCENAAVAGKPSGGGLKNNNGCNKATGLGIGNKASVGGVQTRRGLRDITNKVEDTAAVGGASGSKAGGKKPGARVASASVGSADNGVAAPAASVAVLQSESTTDAVAPVAPASGIAARQATVGGSIAAATAPVQQRSIRTAVRTATDIDLRDADEPLAATEYVEELYEYFREREVVTRVDRGYMERQPNVNERMRSILIDWLVEVHLKFKLVPDTLYLTVYLIDKYLETKKVRSYSRVQ